MGLEALVAYRAGFIALLVVGVVSMFHATSVFGNEVRCGRQLIVRNKPYLDASLPACSARSGRFARVDHDVLVSCLISLP